MPPLFLLGIGKTREGNVNSYLFFVIYRPNVQKCATSRVKSKIPAAITYLGHYMFLGGQWVFWGASGFSDSLAPRASGCHGPMSRPENGLFTLRNRPILMNLSRGIKTPTPLYWSKNISTDLRDSRGWSIWFEKNGIPEKTEKSHPCLPGQMPRIKTTRRC